MKRVVVTGMGMVSPFGIGVDRAWDQLIAGKSGITRVDSIVDLEGVPVKVAGRVPRSDVPGDLNAFNVNDWVHVKEQRKMATFIAFALCAGQQAVEDAGLNIIEEGKVKAGICNDGLDLERIGVCIGSGVGGLNGIADTAISLRDKGMRGVSPFFIVSNLINLPSGFLSIRYGFKGPNLAGATACATGTHSIMDGVRHIRSGEADIMLAGGTESCIKKIGMAGFAAARALSSSYNDTPEKASRPWDQGRDGFVMGEGAGVLVLEELEHAKKRGAKIYAEVTGYASTGDAYHLTAPEPEGDGGYRAMKAAIKAANLKPEDIHYINAHGTSTPMGDMIEIGAIKRLFGGYVKNIPISSTKSSIGHSLGATGALEAIFSIYVLNKGIVPPTLNLENPDEACEGLNLVPLKAQKIENMRHVLSNSFGFGGTNGSIIFSKI